MELLHTIIYLMNKFVSDPSADIVKLSVAERSIEGAAGDDVERGLVERRAGVPTRSDAAPEVGPCNK